MTYKSLLLECGGGISASELNVCGGNGAVCIGLGGTGLRYLLSMKKIVRSSLGGCKNIEYIAIDCDYRDLQRYSESAGITVSTECVHIGVSGPVPHPIDYVRYPWLDQDIGINDGSAGSGGIRQIGRYMFANRIVPVMCRIRDAICSLRTRGIDNITVYIATGLGGGLGSGAFLDLCYMVRRVLEDINVTIIKLKAYCLLSDVYMANGRLSGMPQVCNYIKANTYAALKELDYCMKFPVNGGSWSERYEAFAVNTNKPPVDFLYPISSRNMMGEIMSGGYEKVLSLIAQHTMASIMHGGYPWGKDEGCNLIGIGRAGVDGTAINTTLASFFFKFAETIVVKDKPSHDDVDRFMRVAQIDIDSLFKQLTKDCEPIIDAPDGYDWRMYRHMSDGDGVPHEFSSYFTHTRMKILNSLSVNSYRMTLESRGQDPECTDGRMLKCLMDVICDMRKGPRYAAELIGGNSDTCVLGHLQMSRQKLMMELDRAKDDMNVRQRKVDEIRMRFVHTGPFANRRSIFDEYVNALTEHQRHYIKFLVLENMSSVIGKLYKMLEDVLTRDILPYVRCVDNIIESFGCNLLYTLSMTEYSSERQLAIADGKLLWATLENEITSLDISSVFSSFHGAFYRSNVWNRNENDVCAFVSQFFGSLFSESARQSAEYYIQKRNDYSYTHDRIGLFYERMYDTLDGMSSPAFPVKNISADGHESLMVIIPHDQIAKHELGNFFSKCSCNNVRGADSPIEELVMIRTIIGYELGDYAMIDDIYKTYECSFRKGIHSYKAWKSLPELVKKQKHPAL